MQQKYPFSAYDKYLCLKPDFFLWLVSAFLLRPYVVIILSIANRTDRMGLINMVYSDRIPMLLAAVAAIPAAFVVFAFVKRNPEANDKVKWLWHHGRELLLVSTLLDMAIIFVPRLFGFALRIDPVGWAQFGICAYIVFYLFTEQRVRDTFADFPAPVESDAKQSSVKPSNKQ